MLSDLDSRPPVPGPVIVPRPPARANSGSPEMVGLAADPAQELLDIIGCRVGLPPDVGRRVGQRRCDQSPSRSRRQMPVDAREMPEAEDRVAPHRRVAMPRQSFAEGPRPGRVLGVQAGREDGTGQRLRGRLGPLSPRLRHGSGAGCRDTSSVPQSKPFGPGQRWITLATSRPHLSGSTIIEESHHWRRAHPRPTPYHRPFPRSTRLGTVRKFGHLSRRSYIGASVAGPARSRDKLDTIACVAALAGS